MPIDNNAGVNHFPAPLGSYQFVRATGDDAVLQGAFVDRLGQMVDDFQVTISTTVEDFGTVPADAVGFIGELSHPIRVNTGRDTAIVTVVEGNSWIEYPSPRIALGTVN